MRYLESKLPDGTRYEVGWDGVPLGVHPYLAFDTETEMVDLSVVVPRLACLQVTNGRRHVIVHPGDVPAFVEAHRGAYWVGHNVAFDWHVVNAALGPDRGEWLAALDGNRLRDTMLLDFLCRLARPGGNPTHLRGLGEVAADWLKRDDVDKESPYRQKFGEVIGADWSAVDPGFWEYAILDVIVTHAAYAKIHASLPAPRPGWERHGPQTECLQVRAAVVLAEIGRNGFALDPRAVEEAKTRLKASIDAACLELERQAPGLLKRYKVATKTRPKGSLMIHAGTGVPSVNYDILRAKLVEVGGELRIDLKGMPKTKKTQQLTTALDPWREAAGGHPFVRTWAEMTDEAKLHQFLCQLHGKGAVHASYRPLVRTGRTSCTKPNVQQMPKKPWVRELFVARPGRRLVIVDYSAIELVTLAAVLLDRFGESVLADQIRGGRDPHAYTAALVQGVDYDGFVAGLKAEKEAVKRAKEAGQAPPPTPFADARQAAKAVNFGVPGGLGATKLADYAKANYGVSMTQQEAAALRKKLTKEIYPELGRYLDEDLPARLAERLGTTAERVCEVFGRYEASRRHDFWYALDKVLAGQNAFADGKAIPPPLRCAVWEGLAELTRGTPHFWAVNRHRAGLGLWRALVGGEAVTITGRVRSDLIYTEARNTPFQGLAADGAKVALYRLWREGFTIVAFIHDEIVCEVPADRAEEDRARIEACMIESMSSVLGHPVPVKVEGRAAERWEK